MEKTKTTNLELKESINSPAAISILRDAAEFATRHFGRDRRFTTEINIHHNEMGQMEFSLKITSVPTEDEIPF